MRLARQFNAPGEIDDIVQEIGLKLVSQPVADSIPREPEAAAAYFSVVAANAARDYFRARNCLKRSANKTIPLDLWVDPGTAPAAIDRELLFADVERCLPKDRREQTIFRLYYRQGFSAREIAALPALKLAVKGVESLIGRVVSQVRECLRQSGLKGKSAGQAL
ncbi:MAG TPA: sigma-70 family RNA polymerase sigma factor [Verrucomicrobiae bacterium]|nr:sigma-70 family RNA polymerase sigma factor [Verrucomicrobiae bacterium]